jgi:SEC-C motif-containing protein
VSDEPCPCGGGPYAECCGRYHDGGRAPTAEALMRSRYSAFALGDTAYLLRTWHPDTRPKRLRLDPGQEWTRLEIAGRTGGGLLANEGTVEFRAHYQYQGQRGVLHENSRFRRVDGQWLYLDGTH